MNPPNFPLQGGTGSGQAYQSLDNNINPDNKQHAAHPLDLTDPRRSSYGATFPKTNPITTTSVWPPSSGGGPNYYQRHNHTYNYNPNYNNNHYFSRNSVQDGGSYYPLPVYMTDAQLIAHRNSYVGQGMGGGGGTGMGVSTVGDSNWRNNGTNLPRSYSYSGPESNPVYYPDHGSNRSSFDLSVPPNQAYSRDPNTFAMPQQHQPRNHHFAAQYPSTFLPLYQHERTVIPPLLPMRRSMSAPRSPTKILQETVAQRLREEPSIHQSLMSYQMVEQPEASSDSTSATTLVSPLPSFSELSAQSTLEFAQRLQQKRDSLSSMSDNESSEQKQQDHDQPPPIIQQQELQRKPSLQQQYQQLPPMCPPLMKRSSLEQQSVHTIPFDPSLTKGTERQKQSDTVYQLPRRSSTLSKSVSSPALLSSSTTAPSSEPFVAPQPSAQAIAKAQRRTQETYAHREKVYLAGWDRQKTHIKTLISTLRKQGEMEKAEKQKHFPNVVYVKQKTERKYQRQGLYLSETEIEKVAQVDEMLVPIRLNLEVDGVQLKDTFTWNLNENAISITQFATLLCEDLRLSQPVFLPLISQSIQEQISDFVAHAPAPLYQKLSGQGNDGVEQEHETSLKDGHDLRVMIKLDITIQNISYRDTIEWDLNCRRNDPERVADCLVRDMKQEYPGLGGLATEFRTAIAHSIREQIQHYAKSLVLTNYGFDGQAVENDELNQLVLPVVGQSTKRESSTVQDFIPIVKIVDELEQGDVRDTMVSSSSTTSTVNRRRNQGRKRTQLIPDFETLKTTWTPLPDFFNLPPIRPISRPPSATKSSTASPTDSQQVSATTSSQASITSERRSRRAAPKNLSEDALWDAQLEKAAEASYEEGNSTSSSSRYPSRSSSRRGSSTVSVSPKLLRVTRQASSVSVARISAQVEKHARSVTDSNRKDKLEKKENENNGQNVEESIESSDDDDDDDDEEEEEDEEDDEEYKSKADASSEDDESSDPDSDEESASRKRRRSPEFSLPRSTRRR